MTYIKPKKPNVKVSISITKAWNGSETQHDGRISLDEEIVTIKIDEETLHFGRADLDAALDFLRGPTTVFRGGA